MFRRPKFWVRAVLVLLVLWIVYLIAVPFFAWQKVDKVEFAPDGDRPADQPGTTYLMVGSDSRGDLSEEERKELGTGNAAGQRTDTIMILHTGDGPNLLMSIPRDSRVAIPGHGDDEKINAAFAYGGPKLLTETIENETGIRIDHYVEIGFGGFVDLVDAVGGIEICPKQAIKDPPGQPEHQEGLPGGRRRRGARLLAVPEDLRAGRPAARPGPARGGLRDRARGGVAVDGDQPDPLLEPQHGRHARPSPSARAWARSVR